MKSPVKLDRNPITGLAIGGAIPVVVFMITTYPPWKELSARDIVSNVITLLGLYAIFISIGYVMAFMERTIFTREVTHPADPGNLVIGQTYWLNGSHPAKYLGKDNDSGKFRFSVEGYNNPQNPESSADLTPIRVRTYISTVQEIKPE